MHWLGSVFSVFFLLGLGTSGCTQEVYVELSSGESGHGVLRYDGTSCYVILPKHVVGDPGTITVTARGGRHADAALRARDAEADLALLTLGRADSSMCRVSGAALPTETLDNVLENAKNISLRTIAADGSQTSIKIAIQRVTKQTITFEAENGQALTKGLSGSVIVVDGVRAGIMVNITKGRGVAYRADYVDEFWKRLQPPRRLCESGCEVTLAKLLLVKNYTKSQNNGTYIQISQDLVFRLPEGWPLPEYFHVFRNTIQVQSDIVSVPPSTSILGFSFSSDQGDHASDIPVGAVGYDVTGQALDSFIYENRIWSVSITGTQEPGQISVRIKPVGQ